jgi:NitT/TauT family transport system permease protein
MIGAIIGEYFGGSLEALGANIKQDAALFQFAKAWAEILVACILGIGFYLAVALAERLATRWQPPGGFQSE